jgi:hypothetical protein
MAISLYKLLPSNKYPQCIYSNVYTFIVIFNVIIRVSPALINVTINAYKFIAA